MTLDSQQYVDVSFVDDLRNFLFKESGILSGRDLPAINIQRVSISITMVNFMV